MALYVVSYDLRRERTAEQYKRMHDQLRTASAFCWPLESVWLIDSDLVPSEIIKRLVAAGSIDDDDGIVVLELTGIGDFRRVRDQTVADWLNETIMRR